MAGALVERRAEFEETPPDRGPKGLVKEAMSLGLVGPEDREPLERLAGFHDHFVHAMVADAFPADDIGVAARVARGLVGSPAGTG